MSSECIFCKIVAGKIPCYKVYEDESVLAFLDIYPIREGHVLVIPKVHEPDFYKLDKENYAAVFKTVHNISPVINDLFKPVKVGLIVAGFDVPHAHAHIVPMYENHDITSKRILEETRKHPTPEELTSTADKIKNHL